MINFTLLRREQSIRDMIRTIRSVLFTSNENLIAMEDLQVSEEEHATPRIQNRRKFKENLNITITSSLVYSRPDAEKLFVGPACNLHDLCHVTTRTINFLTGRFYKGEQLSRDLTQRIEHIII